MSAITDWAAREQANLDAVSGRLDDVVTGIQKLNTMITDLQNSPGKLTPEDQKALDNIESFSGGLVKKAADISVNAPAAPLATPTP